MKDQKANSKEVQVVGRGKVRGKRGQQVRRAKSQMTGKSYYGRVIYPNSQVTLDVQKLKASGAIVEVLNIGSVNKPIKKEVKVKSASAIAKEIHKVYMLDIDELDYFATE